MKKNPRYTSTEPTTTGPRTNVAAVCCLFFAVLFCTAGCSEEWWSRGQPLSPSQLLSRSEERLKESVITNGAARPELIQVINELSNSLHETSVLVGNRSEQSPVKTSLDILTERFMGLEGLLSVTSRAPYAELSGQLRTLSTQVETGQKIFPLAFNTFAARVNFFLAREISFPA